MLALGSLPPYCPVWTVSPTVKVGLLLSTSSTWDLLLRCLSPGGSSSCKVARQGMGGDRGEDAARAMS